MSENGPKTVTCSFDGLVRRPPTKTDDEDEAATAVDDDGARALVAEADAAFARARADLALRRLVAMTSAFLFE